MPLNITDEIDKKPAPQRVGVNPPITDPANAAR